MKPTKFDYLRPASLSEALRLLKQHGDGARPIAGGQSLGPMLNLRIASPDILIDLSRLPELTTVSTDPTGVTIGASTTHAAIEDGVGRDETQGMLPRIAAAIAYRPVRNRGTIGGSLAHADPAADWAPVLMALGAQIEIVGGARSRSIDLSELILGLLTTSLDPGELIVAVHIPRLGPGARWSHRKFCKKPGDFAASIAAIVADKERGQHRVVLSDRLGPPVRFSGVEKALAEHAGRHDVERALDDELSRRAAAQKWTSHAASLHRAMMMDAVSEIVP